MNDDDARFNALRAMKVNANPIQRPGQDRLVRSTTVCGPKISGDRAMYLTAKELGHLLDVARSSPLGRVVLERVGFRVDLYQSATETHEVWTLLAGDVHSEQMPAMLTPRSARR